MVSRDDNRLGRPILKGLLQVQYESGRFLELLWRRRVGQIPSHRDKNRCRRLGYLLGKRRSQVSLQAAQKALSAGNAVPGCRRLELKPVRRPKMQVTEMNDRERTANTWVRLVLSTHSRHCATPRESLDLGSEDFRPCRAGRSGLRALGGEWDRSRAGDVLGLGFVVRSRGRGVATDAQACGDVGNGDGLTADDPRLSGSAADRAYFPRQ